MQSMREQILENIEMEAYNHVKDGTPMPVRDAMWASDVNAAVSKAYETVEAELMAKVIRRERKLAENFGMDYETWSKLARALYKIAPDCTVTSIARGPEHERSWPCKSKSAARDKIVQLITIKKYDHFVKGHDFAYLPTEPEVEAGVQEEAS